MTKIIISGYYGFGNTGDEAILQSMVESFKREIPGSEVIVLSFNPKKTAKILNVKAVKRTNYFAIIKEILSCQLFISGGGGLIQDVTSLRSLKYYLGLIWLAQLFKKPTMIYAQSIGPVTTSAGRKLVKRVCNKVNLITVRDENSKILLQKLGITTPPIKVTADPVFSLTASSGLENEIKPDPSKIKIGVSVRPWKANKDYLEVLARVLNYLVENWKAEVLLLPFQFSQDLDTCKILQQKVSKPAQIVPEELSPGEWFNLIKQLDFLIGMRLHSLIMGTMSAIPLIGIVYDPKIASFLRSINIPPIELNTLTSEDLITKLEKTKENYSQIKKELQIKIPEFKEKALENARLAKLLIGTRP